MQSFFELKGTRLASADRRRCACHEAGHALAVILLRRRFEYVTIESHHLAPNGHCKMGAARPIRRLRELASGTFVLNVKGETVVRSREARISLAGIAGELLGCGGFYARGTEDPDIAEAVRHAEELTRKLQRLPNPKGRFKEPLFSDLDVPPKVNQCLMKLFEDIYFTLLVNLSSLHALVEVLLHRGRLSYEEARETIESRHSFLPPRDFN